MNEKKEDLEKLLDPASDNEPEIDNITAQRIDQETGINDWRIKTVIATSPGITKGDIKFINETSRTVDEIKEKIDDSTGANLDKSHQLPTEQREFDENKDGKLDATEDQKYKQTEEKKEEEAKKEAQAIGKVFAGVVAVVGGAAVTNSILGNLTSPNPQNAQQDPDEPDISPN